MSADMKLFFFLDRNEELENGGKPPDYPLLQNGGEGNKLFTLREIVSSTSSNVLLGRGSENAFNECQGVSNIFSSAA